MRRNRDDDRQLLLRWISLEISPQMHARIEGDTSRHVVSGFETLTPNVLGAGSLTLPFHERAGLSCGRGGEVETNVSRERKGQLRSHGR